MKRLPPGFLRVGAAMALFLCALPLPNVSAAILAEESFDYTVGTPLGSLNGGTGFDGAWRHHSTTPGVVTGTTYDYSVPNGGLVSGGATGLQITATSGAYSTIALERTLATTHHGDEVYVSFLLRHNDIGASNNDRFAFWVADQTAGAGPYGGFIQTSTTSFYIRPDASTPATSSGAGQPRFTRDTTYLIVIRFSKSTPGEDSIYDQASLWVNPGANDLSNPLLTSSASGPTASSITQFSTIGLQIRNTHPQDKQYYFDQLVVGTTWNDVVPAAIPEPSTLALALLSAGWLVLRRRRP